MIVAIKHFEWQLLRCLVRAEAAGRTVFGRELRLTPTRKSKDGTVLDDLVSRGLVAVAEKAASLSPGASMTERQEPIQFRTRYRLTKLGKHAAEYGEIDVPHTPASVPIPNKVAALLQEFAPKFGRKREPGKVRTKA